MQYNRQTIGSNLFPYTTLFRSAQDFSRRAIELAAHGDNRELAARYATEQALRSAVLGNCQMSKTSAAQGLTRSEEHKSELQSPIYLVYCLLLEKKKKNYTLCKM